jgi:hypothetical protein
MLWVKALFWKDCNPRLIIVTIVHQKYFLDHSLFFLFFLDYFIHVVFKHVVFVRRYRWLLLLVSEKHHLVNFLNQLVQVIHDRLSNETFIRYLFLITESQQHFRSS